MNRQEAEKIRYELKQAYLNGLYTKILQSESDFESWFDKTYPSEPEYTPFKYTDFKDFMLKEVRRKGEEFKDEIWKVGGLSIMFCALIEPEVADISETTETTWHSFKYMFEEWEFADGKPFGKLKQ